MLTSCYSGLNYTPAKFQPTKPKKSTGRFTRELHLILSDLHVGANLNLAEHGVEFGPIQEARRMASIVKKVSEYKTDHRSETRLNISILGDIFQGKIHDAASTEALSVQQIRAGWVLNRAIAYLAGVFPEIVVRCVSGNHDRDVVRHSKRATDQKWDSYAMPVYYGIRDFLRTQPNVRVELPLTPMLTYKTFGWWNFGTHGDTVLVVGNLGKSLNVTAIELRVNKINMAQLSQHGHRYDNFFVGHVHVGSSFQLPNGESVITNPPLVPPDGFANSIGVFSNSCGQSLFETTAEYAMGDHRILGVDRTTDMDASLDRIIEPFEGIK
jgi:hypothetical protein